MTTTAVGDALAERARAAMVAWRRAEFAVLECAAELDEAGMAQVWGYRSTSRVLEALWRVDAAEAKRLLARAGLVTVSGGRGEPRLPATAAASAEGAVGGEHVRVIAAAVEHLDGVAGLAPGVVAEAEERLAAAARTVAPAGLARVAARLVALLDPDGVAPEEGPEPCDELGAVRRGGDELALKGRLRGANAELVAEVLDALSGPAGPEDPRTLSQRRAEALVELCAQAVSPTGIATDEPTPPLTPPGHDDSGHDDSAGDSAGDANAGRDGGAGGDGGAGDRPSSSGGSAGGSGRVLGRALLTLTIDQRWLREQCGHGLLDSGAAVSAAEARRLACDAGVVAMVLGARGEPLDVGRLSYTVPEGMRRALHLRDGGCAFPGCTRRPRRCQAHHVRHWADGGETSLANTTLLCAFHHHVVHHGGWRIAMHAGRPWFTPPRWVDPDRRPRPGGRAPGPAP